MTLGGSPLPGVSVVPRPLVWVLAGITLGVAAIGLALLWRAPRRRLPSVAPLAVVTCAAGVSTILGFDPRAGLIFTALFGLAVIWHATVARFFDDPGVASSIYAATLISGTLACAAAIAMVVLRQPASLYVLAHGRAVGTFIVPGELAGYLIVFVPLSYALARTGPRTLRIAAYAALAVAATAFLMTFSRAGWLGMAAAFAAFVTLSGRRGAVRSALAIVGAAAIVVSVVFNAHHDPSENFTRISIWAAALGVIARFPLIGVGPAAFARIYPVLRLPDGEPVAFHAHSLVLTLGAEAGIIGLAAAVFAWLHFGRAFAARAAAAPERPTIAIAIVAGLIGVWVQGLIDTVSIAIFALWPIFSAVALASIPASSAATPEPQPARTARSAGWLASASVLALLGGLQFASDAVYSFAAAPWALVAQLPAETGLALYAQIERVAPLPFVEATLADGALRKRDALGARAHAARLPAGSVRDDLLARAAWLDGDTATALDAWLAAGDDEAVQRVVERLEAQHRDREAYRVELRLYARLTAAAMRPNARADAAWRLGRLAWRLGRRPEAARDLAEATALAPFNTKYLVDAGLLALETGDAPSASRAFGRAAAIDPAFAALLPTSKGPTR